MAQVWDPLFFHFPLLLIMVSPDPTGRRVERVSAPQKRALFSWSKKKEDRFQCSKQAQVSSNAFLPTRRLNLRFLHNSCWQTRQLHPFIVQYYTEGASYCSYVWSIRPRSNLDSYSSSLQLIWRFDAVRTDRWLHSYICYHWPALVASFRIIYWVLKMIKVSISFILEQSTASAL